ncbi:MAG: SpoIIE family protein phosphatase [Armatimonadota bacterium]|nr:SpoIIE family protein phosphatase [Armatimonadota bacterium]
MGKAKGRAIPLHIRLAILYAAAAFLAAAGLVVVAGQHAEATVRQRTQAFLRHSAQVAASHIDLVLDELQLQGQVALQPAMRASAHEARRILAEMLQHDARLEGAALYAPNGALLAHVPETTHPSEAPALPPVATSVGRLMPHPTTRRLVVPIQIQPVSGEKGRLVLYVRQSALVRTLVPAVGSEVSPQIVDLRGVPGQDAGQPLDVEAIAKASESAGVTPGREEGRVLLSAGRVRRAPWAILVRIPDTAARDAARGVARRLLPWAMGVILLAAVLGAATAVWVTYPIRRMTASAERVARGALTERTGIHRTDEVGQLAATFDAMAEELRRRSEQDKEVYRREQRRAEVLQALEEVAQAINSTLSLDQVLQRIVARGTQLIGVSRCAITLVDETGALRVRHATGFSPNFHRELETLLESEPCGGLGARGVVVYDLTSESSNPQRWRAEGIVRAACAPMQVEDVCIGSLSIYGKEGETFTEEQLHILGALAAHAAVAVQNARLYEESQRMTRELRSSFRRIGAALASGLRLEDTLALIAELAREMLHTDACEIRLLDESRSELVLRASCGATDGERARSRLGTDEGLDAAVVQSGEPVAVEDVLNDPRGRGPTAETGIRAYLGVPLRVKSRIIGVLAVIKRVPYAFTTEEIDLLASFGAQASVALENRRLYEQESHLAHTLQRSLLPVVPRQCENLELGEIYRPSQRHLELGGDFYDLFPLDHGRVGLVMGDVCGRGLRAAVYTAMAKYAIRSYALERWAPVEVMRKTNRALCRQIVEDHLFVSIAFAVIDTAAMMLYLASAGHPPPVLCRHESGETTLLQPEGTLAGLLPHSHYGEVQARLSPGDVLFLYTDGITEVRRNGEVWGSEALARSVARHRHAPAPDLAQAVLADAMAFAGGEIDDDVAVLAVKVGPA